MIKRVFWVALFTGSSHLIALLTISYIIRELGEVVSGRIGVIDSTIVLVSSVVSFGVQLAVNRNVATKKSWKSNYNLAQSARLMLSFFVVLLGIILYAVNGELQYLIYFFAPLAALNGDYALYGNGKPIVASSLSFLRVAAPNLGLLLASYLGGFEVIYIYIFLMAVGILIAGLISSRVNQVPYLFKPKVNFAKFYLKYYKVGGYQIASALIVPGILVIADWFYALTTIGLINGLLKILIIYKGGLRIIIQAFFKEIAFGKTEEKIDKASLISWGAIAIPVMIFSTTTLNLLFDDKLNEIAAMMPFLGVIMFLGSFRNSAEIRVLMLKNDDLNLRVFLFALAMQTIVLIGFSYTENYLWGIPLALFMAEIIVVLGLGYGLGKFKYFVVRFRFLLNLVPPLLISFVLKYAFGASWQIMVAAIIIYIAWALIFFRKLIFDSLTK